MGTRTFRVTMSFDDVRENDIISELEHLNGKRKLGPIMTSMIRMAFDEGLIFKDISTDALSANRQKFFDGLTQEVKEQDKKIDSIYRMCEDLYGLAKANKALGLDDKATNLMLSQFVLQRQQSELKKILGENDIGHMYESDRLLNEKEKAEKIWGFITEVYEGMIAEAQSSLVRTVEVQPAVTVKSSPDTSNKDDADDEFVELTEKPKEVKKVETKKEQAPDKKPEPKSGEIVIELPDSALNDAFMALL